MKNFVIILLLNLFATSIWAQLPNGSVAPNWTLVDINGVSHTLYDYLDDGKTVYIDFSATWCSTCWNYHQTHALEDLYQMFGPDGTDQVMVFFIEGEENSNTNCLYDISGCNNSTQGDWTDGVSHPIIDDASINGLYDISGFPTIYGICSNRIITKLGRDDVEELTEFMVDDCIGEVDFQNANVTDETCFGEADGEININVDGGPEPFSFQWSNGATSEDLEDLPQGTYTCTITNATGTEFITDPITVSGQTSGLAIEVSLVEDVTCQSTGGAIQITATGGNTPYDFDWSNGASSQNLNDVPAGTYSVTVVDDEGCDQVINNIEISEADIPVVAVEVNEELNCNNSSVTITGTTSGAGNNLTYQWTTTNGIILSGANTLVPSVSAPGEYTLVVTNSMNGCEVMASAVVTEVPALNVDVSSQLDNDCNGASNGAISVTASGGSSPYNYNWSNGTTGKSNTNLAAGSYIVTVTDVDNCTETLNVSIDEPTAVTANISSQADVLCFGESNGFVALAASGGVGNYFYNWSDGGNGNSRNNLPEGTFLVTVSDGNICTETINVTVNQPSVLSTNVTTVGESALNANDGSATVTPSGGTTPYFYMWSTGATTATASNLSAGSYSVTVTDANECTNISNGVVSDFDCAISANIVGQDVLCNGETNGSAMVQISGGAAPYNYQWSNGGTSPMINNLAAGTYSLTLTDNNDCPTIASVSIQEPTVLSSNVSSNDETGFNANDGTATVQGVGGTAPYSYMWSTGETTTMINELTAGSYGVTITDANNCPTTGTAMINAFNCTITANINGGNLSCNNAADGTAMVEATGGSAPFNYIWSNGSTDAMLSNLTAGLYTVTVTDDNDCPTIESVMITEPTMVEVSIFSDISAVCFNEANGSVTISATGGTGEYITTWEGNQSGNMANDLAGGTYIVTVTDTDGCSQTTQFSIGENPEITFTVNTVNNDMNASGSGSIDIDVAGGTAPFTYQWSLNGSMVSTAEDPSGLMAGDYICVITDSNDCTLTSEVITVDNLTNLTERDLAQNIRLYPNPTANHLHIHMIFDEAYEVQTTLFNVTGKQLMESVNMSSAEHHLEWDLVEYPRGLYFVKIRVGESVITKKIIVR